MEHIPEINIEELLETHRFLQATFNGIRDQIMVVDSDYRIKEVNESFVKRLGKPRHEIVGKYCYRLLHDMDKPCDMPNHPCPVQETLKTGKFCEVLHTHLEGREASYYRVTTYPVLDDQGAVTHVIEIARDITRRKKAEDQVYSMQRLASLGELAAGVAHELNNPVGIILGFANLLMGKTEPGSKEYEMVKIIERQGLNCKRIVESLLSFASRYPEKIEYSADVNVNLERMIFIVENILVSKKISLERNLAEDLPKVRGDPGHLQQVFMNLITNAVAAMEGGGVLTISTRLNEPDDRVKILFSDTGHGIKKEHRDRIFDPFFTTREVGEGSGLGLSVSYGIVTRYGGTITFETLVEEEDRERKGTTFTVSLPVVPSESKPR